MTIDGRLLCACACAYGINAADGAYIPPASVGEAAGYLQTPQAFSGSHINAALVGPTSDGIVVAFRGTLSPIPLNNLGLRDWMVDFFEVPKSVPQGATFVPGQVHAGFYDATVAIIGDIAKAVRALNPAGSLPVYVTGHSKGGAMASIGAYILQQGFGIKLQPVVTFASPRPGDSGFQAGEPALLQQTRYENYGDLVPLLPPSHTPVDLLTYILNRIPDVGSDIARVFSQAKDWDYKAVGKLLFIEDSNQHYAICEDEGLAPQVLAVLEEVGRDLLARNFSSIVDAHTLNSGYGYMSGVCPGGV